MGSSRRRGLGDASTWRAAAFLVGLASVACSLVSSADGLTGSPAGEQPDAANATDASGPDSGAGVDDADASALDAPAEASSSPDGSGPLDASGDAADGGCANAMLNPSFDDKASCDPWTNYGGTAAIATPAHSGANACRVCGTVNNVNATLFGQTVAPGDAIHFEAWIRAADSDLLAVPVLARILVGGEGNQQVLLTTSYQKVTVDHVVEDAGPFVPTFQFLVYGPADAGDCMLIDDVSVCITPGH